VPVGQWTWLWHPLRLVLRLLLPPLPNYYSTNHLDSAWSPRLLPVAVVFGSSRRRIPNPGRPIRIDGREEMRPCPWWKIRLWPWSIPHWLPLDSMTLVGTLMPGLVSAPPRNSNPVGTRSRASLADAWREVATARATLGRGRTAHAIVPHRPVDSNDHFVATSAPHLARS